MRFNRFRAILFLLILMAPCLLYSSCETTPLSLDINDPTDGSILKTNLIRVTGTVSNPEATVMINEQEAHVANDGSFYAYVELSEGDNTVEAVARLGRESVETSVNVIFYPSLAVYLRLPESSEYDKPFLEVPITVTGYVFPPNASVRVGENQVQVDEDGSFSSQVQLQEGNNIVRVEAVLDDEDDTYRYIIGVEEGDILFPPGQGLEYTSRFSYEHAVVIEAGETEIIIDVSADIRKDIAEPGELSCDIYMVEAEYSEEEVPMPVGLEVSIEPSCFTVYPNTTYHITISITTTPELTPGEYFLRFEQNFESRFWSGGWIRVTIEP